MEDIFKKLYKDKISEIHNFLNSDFDILYITGFSGSGKSYVLKTALKLYENDILNFNFLCFKKTVTDDILLSFYDTFRMYALRQTISLKKNPEEEFVQKVNFYFKNLEYPSVVVIDNFEEVDNNKEITDLLIHISSFSHVKVIVISKKASCALVENPTVSLDTINFEKISPENFRQIMSLKFKNTENEIFDKLYSLTDGFELYVKMLLTYIESVGISLSEFMFEFERKNISFNNFIIEKQVSLIPTTYYPFLKNLAFIHHNVSPAFLETYGLGDDKRIQYLLSKFAVSEFWGTYYIKSYLRKYFVEAMTFQNKNEICKGLILIYENELKKSPKDRLLRMSRESIRNQIALLEDFLPSIAKKEASIIYNFMPNSMDTGYNNRLISGTAKGKPLSRLELLRQKSAEKKTAQEAETKKPSPVQEGIFQAEFLEKEYKYKEAISVLEKLCLEAKNLDEKEKIYSKLAQNLLKLNDTASAIFNLKTLCEECKKAGDINSFSKYKIKIGRIYKKQYAFSRAKSYFMEIENAGGIKDEILAEAEFSLGEIFELEENPDEAIKKYRTAFDLILNSSGETSKKLPDISYKIALLYDEEGYQEEALREYSASIKYSETSSNTTHNAKAYAASGIILSDMGDDTHALECLNWALELSKNSENHLDSCYIARNIANIYKNLEPEKSYDYLQMALEYAKTADNSFEVAICELELGDYYYNAKQNEQALVCYFEAKKALGKSVSKENSERIATRINDMKIKLGDFMFREIQKNYES